MPAAARIIACILILFAVSVPSARAAPVLELSRTWYEVVEPYRYVEARRFERGWNRGADVLVPDGRVRAPLAGRVRFAGDVAGRTVVTLDAIVEGEPAVVTVTGLDAAGVRAGDVLRSGAVLGRGDRVHVGAYDPDRRSRYLPVRAAGESVAGAAADVGDRATVADDGSLVADAVADRLYAAITGFATPAARMPRADLDVLHPPGAFRRGPQGGVASATQTSTNSTPWVRFVEVHRRVDARGASWRTGDRIERRWIDVDHDGPGGAVERGRRPATAGDMRAPAIDVGDLDVGEALPRTVPSGGTAATDRSVRRGGPTRSSGAVDDELRRATHGPVADRDPQRELIEDRLATHAGGRGSARASAWPIPLVLLVALLPIAVFVRRRARPARRPRTRIREPLPIALPHVRPYAYPVVGRDGASMLPDIALAWPDREAGMGPDPESPAPACEREPEHA